MVERCRSTTAFLRVPESNSAKLSIVSGGAYGGSCRLKSLFVRAPTHTHPRLASQENSRRSTPLVSLLISRSRFTVPPRRPVRVRTVAQKGLVLGQDSTPRGATSWGSIFQPELGSGRFSSSCSPAAPSRTAKQRGACSQPQQLPEFPLKIFSVRLNPCGRLFG
jgi:hypothetical protein